MATQYEQQLFFEQLESEFAQKKQEILQRWSAFKDHLEANKSNWDDGRYFYFEKRVMEVEQAVLMTENKIDNQILPFLEYKKNSLEQHRQ